MFSRLHINLSIKNILTTGYVGKIENTYWLQTKSLSSISPAICVYSGTRMDYNPEHATVVCYVQVHWPKGDETLL